MNSVTKADLFRYDGLSGTKGFLKAWGIPGFRYTFLLRKMMKYKKLTIRGVFFRILYRLLAYKEYHIDINAQISGGFYLYHRGTVYIGPIQIGKNCTVGHLVTIGRSLKGGEIGRPTLGENVWIGTGAVIVGKVFIGNDVLIAPNSFVNFDVPDKSLVIGNPGKIIKKDNPTKHYINNTLD